MRTLSPIMLIVAIAVLGCSEQSAPSESAAADTATAPSGTASTTTQASISAKFGGTMVTVGSYQVELKLFQRGHAEAWVHDAGGAVVKSPAVKLAVKQEGAEALVLGWSAPLARFSADADAQLKPLATEVELRADGKALVGKIDKPVLLVGPRIGGTLVATAEYGLEMLASADGSIEALVSTTAGASVLGGVDLAVNIDAVGGKMQRIALEWDADLVRFRGQAKAGVKLAAGPLVIFISDKLAARLPHVGISAKASHGGKIVAVGDYSVELVADGNIIAAFVADVNAKAHAAGDLGLTLMLSGKPFTLKWDPPSASYRVALDADVDLELHPIQVAINAGGKISVGALAGAKAKLSAEVPKVALNADVNAKADLNAKAGAGAKVGVKAPAVKAPSVKAGAGAKAGTDTSGGKAKAGAKADFSIGTK